MRTLLRIFTGDGAIGVHAFLGASFLESAILLPHARAVSIGGGVALAGVIRWSWLRWKR